MEGNCNIFICTHKGFEEKVKNEKTYRIITGENCDLKNSYSVPIIIEKKGEDSLLELNPSLGEGSRIYWVWKHVKDLPEYIGFCHYRRFFSFLDEIPNFDSEFKTCDVILPIPLKGNLVEQYRICHNVNDILKIDGILKDLLGIQDLKKINCIIPGNMFIMRKSDFFQYCEFVFKVLFEFMRRNKLKTIEDIDKYVEGNRDRYQFYDFKYQRRILGFLMERISIVYFLKKFKNPKFVGVVKT